MKARREFPRPFGRRQFAGVAGNSASSGGGAAGGDFVEKFGAERGVVAFAGEIEQTGTGADAFGSEIADAGGDGSLCGGVDAFDFIILKNIHAGPAAL